MEGNEGIYIDTQGFVRSETRDEFFEKIREESSKKHTLRRSTLIDK